MAVSRSSVNRSDRRSSSRPGGSSCARRRARTAIPARRRRPAACGLTASQARRAPAPGTATTHLAVLARRSSRVPARQRLPPTLRRARRRTPRSPPAHRLPGRSSTPAPRRGSGSRPRRWRPRVGSLGQAARSSARASVRSPTPHTPRRSRRRGARPGGEGRRSDRGIAAMAISGSPTATVSSGPPASRATNHSHGRAITSAMSSTRRARRPRETGSTARRLICARATGCDDSMEVCVNRVWEAAPKESTRRRTRPRTRSSETSSQHGSTATTRSPGQSGWLSSIPSLRSTSGICRDSSTCPSAAPHNPEWHPRCHRNDEGGGRNGLLPGADDGIRTRDPHLGKVVLYH